VTRVSRMLGAAARLAWARTIGAALPYSVTFILTHRCNFRCTYCNAPAAAGTELTTAQVRRALDELAASGLGRASFSGGEPLLRADAVGLVKHAHSLGLLTSLNSNGWLTGRDLDRLAPYLDMLVVSLDAANSAHDEVRRQPGSFERVLEVLTAARARGLATATISVLGAWNLDQVEDILSLAARLGAWAYFQPAYIDCFDHLPGLDPAFAPGVLAQVAERLRVARAAGLPVGASGGYLERLARGPRFGSCEECHAGRYFATVMPDGTMVPCHLASRQTPAPNGLESGFAHAFFALRRDKFGPGCAISPYQETDLLFRLDARAISAAMRRLAGPPARAAVGGPR